MKSLTLLFVLALSSAVAIAAQPAPVNPHTMAPAPAAAETSLPQKARVVSTIDVPQYTYLEVMQDKKTRWLAAPSVKVKKGDVIRFDNGMEMTNFHSRALNRNFASISFVGRVVVTNEKE